MLYVLLAIVLAILAYLIHVRRSAAVPQRKGVGAVALAFGLVFSAVLDPAKKAAFEELDRQRDRGRSDAGESGEKL